MKCFMCKCMYCIGQTNLRHVDAALLEGAVIGIVGTHMSIFAPVAWKRAIHTGETPIKKTQQEKKSIIKLLMATYSCIVYQTMTFRNYRTHSYVSHKLVLRALLQLHSKALIPTQNTPATT